MYLAVSDYAFNAILFHHVSDKEQRHVYYVSKEMVDVETQYSKMEQMTLALKNAAQNLYPYFQAHQVIVLTNQLLRSILNKLDLSERILKWAIEQVEYEAILARLDLACSLATIKLKICSDFQ